VTGAVIHPITAMFFRQGDHGQVREARGKGFVPSLLRGDPQHSPEDLDVGHHNEHKTTNCYTGTNQDKPNFPKVV